MPKREYDPEDFDALMRQVDALLEEPDQSMEPDFVNNYPEEDAPVANYANGYGRAAKPAANPLPAYNPDMMKKNKKPHTEQRPVQTPKAVRPAEPARPKQTARPRYEEPAYEEPEEYEPPKKPKKKKKHHPIRNFFLLLLLLLIGAGFWGYKQLEQPMTDTPMGARKDGASTILLCGTDADGTRTDTMMLLYINVSEKQMNLVSLPRDTMTRTTAGNYAKLNSAFGRNNGGNDPKEGMEALMDYVKDIIGYRPDGYVLVDLDCFVDVVNLMGGVDFEVPQDMYYEDPTQDLLIDLKEGMQHLDGYQAMGLVRFRKGYATQDLGRVEVQRDFIFACMKQWMTPANAVKLPEFMKVFSANSVTDLSMGNFLWLGVGALRCGFGNLKTATLPGYADMVNGASYYVLYRSDTADTVNTYCNPYVKTISVDDLTIAQ